MNNSSAEQDVLYRNKLVGFLKEDTYLDFLKRIRTQTRISYISLTFPVQAADPLAGLHTFGNKNEFQYFWEIPHQKLSIAAGRELISLRANGPSRFQRIQDQIDDIKSRTSEYSVIPHRCSGLNFLGGFSFHDDNDDPIWKPFEAASFSVPEWVMVRDGKVCYLTVTIDISTLTSEDQINRKIHEKLQSYCEVLSRSHTDGVLNGAAENTAGTNLSLCQSPSAYEQWIESVKKAKDFIHNKHFDKIVLAREFTVDTNKRLAPIHIINDLRQRYPNCYSFLIGKRDGKNFIGCSPERLAAFRNQFLLTEALAGSSRRGNTATEDHTLAERLLGSTKNISEHHFVIKAIEHKLKPFTLNMDRDMFPRIKKFNNVQHLFTPITVRLRKNVDRFSILKALHPTPAVGGYPWKKASEYLRGLEHFDRGWYAGAVGWLNGKGDGDFSVAIRCGLVHDTIARFYAGCGIVADSTPDAEWRETNLKLMPMLSALRYD